MKPKVTTAIASLLALLLLSEITWVASYPLYGFTVIPNTKRKPSENCAEYKSISKWFDLQSAVADRLKKHNAYLDEALGSKASKDCCFYDKDLMQSVIDNVHNLDQQNGIKSKNPFKSRGELSKDLNQIIPRIKKLVAKGFKSCCSAMDETLRKSKKDLHKQLENVKHKLKSDTSDEFSKDKKELEEKHKSLTDKIKDIKESLDKLENREDVATSGSQSSCCSGINTTIEELENQMKGVTTETLEKSNQFENQLKDIENVLQSLKNRVKDAKTTLDTQGESIETELEKCETKIGDGPNNQELCRDKLVPRIKKLQEIVISLVNSQAKLGSQDKINLTINACLEDDKKMENIKVLIDKSENIKEEIKARTATNKATCSSDEMLKERAKMLEQEIQDLGIATNKSANFCENIDKLNTFADNLVNKVDQMKQIYADYIKRNKLELEDQIKQLNGTLTELDKINKNNDTDFPKLKSLQEMLQKVQNELKALESEANELSNPKDNHKLSEDFEKMANETDNDKFWLEVDTRLSQLEDQVSKGVPDNTKDAWNRLEKLYNDLSQDMDKAKGNLKKLEKLYQLEPKRLIKLENQVAICLKACKEVPKMYGLLKRLTDIMKAIKTKPKAKVPKARRRTKQIEKTSKEKKAAKNKKINKDKSSYVL